MSLNVYRTYTAGIRCSGSTSTLSKRFLAVASRHYATESALASKTKGAASAKSKHRATGVTSAGEKHVPAKVMSRTTGHPGNEAAAEVKTLPLQHRPNSATGTLAAAAVESTKSKVEAAEKTLEEQNLQELEAIQYFGQVMRSADPYGQPIPQSLDVTLSRPADFSNGVKGWWSQFVDNRLNGLKNAMSLLYLAADDALPGQSLGNIPWYKALGWIPKAFRAQSTKDGVWVAPLRRILLESYADLNQVVASRDAKKAKIITTSDFQNEILRRIKKQPAGFHFKWNLDKEHSVQIISIRAAQYYMAREAPKFGSRYLLHALVKFETEQSLEIYGPNGKPLHEVPEGAVKRANGTIPAKPKRVTEYLVMEKRLWYDTPWVFREQRWAPTKN